MPKPNITYRPDKYADGRYVLLKVTDGVAEQVEVHFDADHINKLATELNRNLILDTLFGEDDSPIGNAAKKFASAILEHSPRSADQSTAIRCVREAVLWAQQAITLDGYA